MAWQPVLPSRGVSKGASNDLRVMISIKMMMVKQ